MNILYMGFIDIKNEGHIGVRKKILSQIKAMKKNGMNVDYVLHDNEKLIYKTSDEEIFLSCYRNGIERRYNMLHSRIVGIAKKRNIDTIYIRYPISDILFIKFLKEVKKNGIKIYLEIPTYPYDKELKNTTLIIDKIFRKKLKRYVDYMVTSSDRYKNIFETPCKFVDNCVSVDDIKLKKRCDYSKNNQINLIAVAFLNNWHGYDKVIEGLKEYYSRETRNFNINFKIIGIGNDYDYLKQLTDKYNLASKVELVGSKNGEELDEAFEEADIALSSLAIHRKDLQSVSSLKSREYCARGIPFVYAGKDPGFSGKEDFALKIESNDDYINMDNIIEFYNGISSKNSIRNDMRSYAKKNFEWEAYFKEL